MANIVSNHDRPAPLARSFSEWDPFELMRDFFAFDPTRDIARRWFGEGPSFMPRFDAREDADCYVIKADMPGIKQSDLDINVTGNRLVVSGQRQSEKTDESKAYYTRERSFGSFSRTFTLPESIDTDHINASMQDGVLEIRVPKNPEAQAKKIPVQAKGSPSPSGAASSESSNDEPQQQAPKEEGM